MRRWLVILLTAHFLWGVVGVGFGWRFYQPADFYSIDAVHEQLRSDADNRLDDHLESFLTQHGLMDELPDMPDLLPRATIAALPAVAPSSQIDYVQIHSSAPALEVPVRPPSYLPLIG
ncbi:MAG: hypothetical protein ACOY95_08305 [Pseudomonadota bacterium]